MKDRPDLDRLEQRARSAAQGYGADVNINCYVYGRDVLALVEYVRSLEMENEKLRNAPAAEVVR